MLNYHPFSSNMLTNITNCKQAKSQLYLLPVPSLDADWVIPQTFSRVTQVSHRLFLAIACAQSFLDGF